MKVELQARVEVGGADGAGRLAGEAQEDTAGEGVVSRSGAGESRRHIEEML